MNFSSQRMYWKWVRSAQALVVIVLCLGLSDVLCTRCRADFVLVLTSPDAPGTKAPGDVLTFNVSLSTSDPFVPLSTVITGIEFDPALLGTPISSTLGPIVPTPDNGALTFSVGPGSVSFIFDSLLAAPTPAPFNATGVLFSFQVQVQPGAQGVAVVDFLADPLGTLVIDNLNQPVVTTFSSSNNSFAISTVPEPASLACLALGAIGVVTSTRRLRRILV